ncbi:MAG: hypothetical protein CMJ34_02045 [Phycisphaerae bacterium]|nr:hypothetical protein [Phycisphaerae bacterium]
MSSTHRSSILHALLAAALLGGSSAAALSGHTTDQTDPDPPASSTREVRIDGRSLGGFVLPVLPIPHDLRISAQRTVEWTVDDTKRLLLSGDVTIEIGSYDFRSSSAVVWINRLPTADGLVTQFAAWFPSVSEPTRRAGLGASGRDVLITSCLDGEVKLSTVILEPGPIRSREVAEGEKRLARYLRRTLATPAPSLNRRPDILVPDLPPEPVLEPGGTLVRKAVVEPLVGPDSVTLPNANQSEPDIFNPKGLVSFSADEIVVEEDRDAIAVVGSVVIDYDGSNSADDLRRLSLVAERGVVFLTPGTIRDLREGAATVPAESIEGIYLEGGVRATDGEYTLRGSSVYYDLPLNQAVIMDAVLRTYTRQGRRLPVYARADEMRQIASEQWTASRATVSTSEFFTPHLSIGLERVTVTEGYRGPSGMDEETTWIQGRGLTLKAGTIPFFYLPTFEGTVEQIPLQDIRIGYQEDKGVGISTRWNAWTLLGLERIDGVDAEISLDGWIERGPAAGLDLELSDLGGVSGSGRFDAYGLYDLGGTDRTAAGRNVDIDRGMRGQIVGEYRATLSADLYLEAQLAYLSDETWASAWRERDFKSRREYESSIYLDYSPDNTSLSFLVKTDLDDFLSNSYMLASRPYFVEKYPEIDYDREGDDIENVVTWSSRWNFSSMSLDPTAGTSDSLGVRLPAFAVGFDGTNGDTSIDGQYLGAGYNEQTVNRFHTRQELSIPIDGEGWTIAPFVFGRFDGYLQGDDELYRTQQGIEAEQAMYRVMLGGGARASTQFQTIDNSARSDLFDIHRLRHILEPNTTLWYGWADRPTGSVPVYDQRIEGATGGTAAQVGMRQTLQTQRGGVGNRRSVDVLVLDYGAVINDPTDDFQRPDLRNAAGRQNYYAWAQSPYPQFYRWEPELSQWGTHAYGSAIWQVSSSLTLATNGLFNWETRDVYDYSDPSNPVLRSMAGLLRGSTGVQFTHNPDTSSYLEYRYLGASRDELLQAGLLYRIGRLYQVGISPQYDLRRDEFRAVSGTIRRKLPDFDFSLSVGYDLIRDQTVFGMSLRVPPQPGVGFPTY